MEDSRKVTQMFLPKTPVVYERLTCELRDFQKMLGELRLEWFSGYILVDCLSARYTVFLEKGEPVRVISFSQEKAVYSNIEAVRMQMEDTPACIQVVKLPWFSVDQMVRIPLYDCMYEHLLTDFVNFKKLLKTLEKNRHTGTMELQIGDRVHFLIFKYGIPQFSVLQYESSTKKESVEELIDMVERKGALINFYVPKDISLEKIFEMLGNSLLKKYGELNGKRLITYMIDEMNTFLEHFSDIAITDECYSVSRTPSDFREQEQIFKEILHHQIELFRVSVGRKTTYRVYNHLLQSVDKDVREIFREVIL